MADIEGVESYINEHIEGRKSKIDLSNYDVYFYDNILEKLSKMNYLIELDLSHNYIPNISILEDLILLEVINLSYNEISDISSLKELKKLREINLSNNEIIDISPLERINNLQSINLSENEIIDISNIRDLKKIKVIDFSYNEITNISYLGSLKELADVNLKNNHISDCSCLKGLKKLKFLDLGNNKIYDISFVEKLKKLEIISFRSNEISDIKFLKELYKLKWLDLSNNKILDYSFLKNLKELRSLDLSNNKITDYSFLEGLKKLETIHLNNNQIYDLSFLSILKQLKTLYLSNNQISDISTLFENKNLINIDLRFNKIKYISFDFLKKFPNLKSLYLHGNEIKNIPQEFYMGISKNCLEKVKDYLKSIEKEEDRRELNEAKLIFVGVGEVGKTELSEALSETEYKFEGGRKFTKGIRIKPWLLENCEREEQKIDFIAHIWDFAGQEINYGTHQFFLTKNSIYVFVWETRKGEDESKFAYWLRIVSLLSKNARIFIVQNKIDELEGDLNQKQWKDQFKNIVGFYKTSCKDGTGINELRADIQKELIELPHTREIWNKYRVAVRDELLESSKNIDYIRYKDYVKICEKHTVSKEDAPFLSDQLHNIGSILHFSEEARLKNTVVLNSEWITDAAYLLLDTKKVERGRFHFKDLDKIWEDDRFDEKHEFLINLIEKFELIFKLNEADVYIVPEGLPVEEPIGVAEIKPTFENEKTKYLRFEYHYPFMPKGILSRFICRLHENIFKEYFWKNGVVLVLEAKEKETFAKVILNEVENPKTIKIEVWGKQADKLLAIIRRNIDHIHSKFEDLEIFQKIPCVCVDCKDSSKPHLHDYDTLIRFQEKGKTTRECAIGAEDVEITTLLDGILDTKTTRGNRLIELIERNNLSEFFAELDRMGIRGNEIASLKDEFISGTNDFSFHSRLITLVSKF